jgi:hypothetical protein
MSDLRLTREGEDMRRTILVPGAVMALLMFAMVGAGAALADTDFSASDSPTTKEDCKNGGYKEFGFKNQGQCIKAVVGVPPPPADTTPPEITVSGPEGTVSEDQVTFTLSTNEPVTWKCTYTLTRPGESTPVLYGIDPCATGTQSFFTEHDGTWVFTFEATDAAGNTSTVTKTLIRDRTDPT